MRVTAERCTVAPLGVGSFHRTGPWKAKQSKKFLRGSLLYSNTAGATLTLAGVAARRVTLYASTCPNCGKVDVLWRGKKIKTVSLAAPAGKHKQPVSLFTVHNLEQGTLTLRVASGKVEIEGLAISRV